MSEQTSVEPSVVQAALLEALAMSEIGPKSRPHTEETPENVTPEDGEPESDAIEASGEEEQKKKKKPHCEPRGKWHKERKNVAVGDIVLLVDKETSRSKWNMGLITDVYPGQDGLVRSVQVKTVSGTYDRPITKLTILLSKEEQNEME